MSLFNAISIVIAVVALCGYLNFRLLKLPDNIGITAVALLISLAVATVGTAVPAATAWGKATVGTLDFPQLLFHGLLGPLLFAGSLQVDFAGLLRSKWTILILATLGVAISTAVTGVGFFYGARALGINLPFIDSLLFGALISPTDPLAALDLLRKAKVPPLVLTKITGEALFNDSTGIVLFLLLIGIASGAQMLDVTSIASLLARQLAGGVAFGLAIGFLGCFLLRPIESHIIETLITLAMPTAGYAAAEALHVSAPIAAVVMGLVVGSYGRRYALSDKTRQRLFPFWDLTAELLTILIYGLIGLQLSVLEGFPRTFLGPALIAIPIVLLARVISVGLPILALKRFEPFAPHTVKLMTCAGLRGALSVAMALSISAAHSRDVIVAATYVVAVFSILVQATTAQWLAKRWMAA